MSDFLTEIKEYLEERADAEYFTERPDPVPNEEMKLLSSLEEYLEDSKLELSIYWFDEYITPAIQKHLSSASPHDELLIRRVWDSVHRAFLKHAKRESR